MIRIFKMFNFEWVGGGVEQPKPPSEHYKMSPTT